MPPRTRSSKKRARSPSPDSNPSDKTQTRSSERTEKDALATTAASTIAAPTFSVAVSKSKDKDAANDRLAAPRFNGNFDMYAMRLPFLNSVFTPRRDYAALLKVIRTYQAKPDNTAQIFLPEDLSKAGRFESLAILDPLQEWPFDLALRSLTLKDSVKFTAREAPSNTCFSDAPAATPGVTTAVALTHDQCGISSSKGAFKMRRAWVSPDGKDEVFEGVFTVSIIYSSLYRSKCNETSLRDSFAFWAIRARVGEDGKEIGLGPGSGRRFIGCKVGGV